VTILVGDSNIGKSTILEVLATRARADGHVVGTYECPVEGPDPLLKSLDDACQQLQGDWAVLLGEAGRDALRTLTLHNREKLYTFLGQLGGAASDAVQDVPYLGAAAKLLRGAIGAGREVLAGARENVLERTTIPADFLKTCEADVFSDIIAVLRTLLPAERSLVLIVDNISATARRGGGHWDTLTSYIHRDIREATGVHILLGWRRDEAIRTHLETLRNEAEARLPGLRGAVIRDIGPTSVDSLREGLAGNVPWFTTLPAATQRQLGEATRGLPAVVAEWGRHKGAAPGTDELLTEASQVVDGSYSFLLGELLVDPDLDTLYQLALLPNPESLARFARMTGSEPNGQALHRWDLMRVLHRDGDQVLRFSHDIKREKATEAARSLRTPDYLASLARPLVDYFLENVGFDDESDPLAPLYLSFARAVGDTAGLEDPQAIAVVAAADALYANASPEPAERLGFAVLRELPWNVRFLLWHVGLAGSGRSAEPLAAILDGNQRTSSRPANVARGLVNAALTYGDAADLDAVASLLDELRAVNTAYPDDPAVREPLARSLFNAANDYANAADLGAFTRILGELRALNTAYPDDPAVRELLAQALSNAAVDLGDAADLDAVARILGELHALNTAYPDDAAVREPLAKALFNAAFHYGNVADLEALSGILGELRALSTAFSDDPAVRVQLAKALCNAALHCGNADDLEAVSRILGELRALRTAFPEDATVREQLANALRNAAIDYGNAADVAAVTSTLGELRALCTAFPDDAAVREQLAKALVNAAVDHGNSADLDAATHILGELRALNTGYPDDAAVREQLAGGLFNAAVDYGKAGDLEAVAGLVKELRDLNSAHPEDDALRAIVDLLPTPLSPPSYPP
jgi:hypothetical protein